MTIHKNHFPTTLFATIDADDDAFVHLVVDDNPREVVCKSTKKIAVYKLERVEEFNWDDFADEQA